MRNKIKNKGYFAKEIGKWIKKRDRENNPPFKETPKGQVQGGFST